MVGMMPRRKRPDRGRPALRAASTRSSVRASPPHGLGPDGRQLDIAACALDHRGTQNPLQLLYAGRQGRLTDMGGLGRAAERGVFGQKLEILKLSQGGEHESDIRARYHEIKIYRLTSSKVETSGAPGPRCAIDAPGTGRSDDQASARRADRGRSKRSAFMTRVQAVTKSRTNFPSASSAA